MQFPRLDGLASGLRLPPIETYPRVVGFAQTLAGKLALFVVFVALMKLNARGLWMEAGGMWLLLSITAAAVSLAGRHRQLALFACAVALLLRSADWIGFDAVWATIRHENLAGIRYVRVGTLLACFPLAAIAIVLARRYREHPLGRRPVLAQHLVYFCLLGLAVSHALKGLPQVLLWSLTAVYASYFSFLAYALIDQRHRQPRPLLMQFATANPFCFPTPVPMGKGAANWASLEADSAHALSVTQLKAIKLLAWAFVIKLVLWVYRWVIYEKLGVPPLKLAFERYLLDGSVPVPSGLATVVANFPEQLLQVAIWGHVIIAIARFAGFRLLRNTWRPLSSRTIAEFWNRYLYYFKEVLVHVYFYPTYVRCFKRHPRLRIAFATFMAAGVGNFFLHFLREGQGIVQVGLLETLNRMQTYAFYCAALTAGIVLSQLRPRAPQAAAGWLRAQLLPSLWVAAFFCFLSVFDGPQRHVALATHFAFLFKVFGIG